MIRRGVTEVSSVNRGKVAVSAVYRGALLVWESIRSCFGSGMWFNHKPWIDTDPWRNR